MHKVGDMINSRWKLVEKLRSDSGQGNTFLVVDTLKPDDETRYVIKLLKVADPKALARFDNEVKASLALQHPNMVKVIDAAYLNTTTPYLVTVYCSGHELTVKKIKDLPLLERLRMFEAICDAIAHAHREGVIHRDIKPGNVFLENADSFVPIVGDFGLCFFNEDENIERPTAANESMGNWQFGPPERSRRQDLPSASFDVYQLGKLLYWLLSGGVVLDREDYDTSYFDLRTAGAEHAVYLAYEVLAKSVAKEASHRYENAARMLDDVKELVELAEREGRYLDCDIPQACLFCRVGYYDWQCLGTHSDDRYQLAEYGLTVQQAPNPPYLRTLFGRCRRCGNVQQFRLGDHVKPISSWKNVPRSPHAR